MNSPIKLTLLSATVLLSGCFEPRLNTEQLCDKYPSIQCAELNMNDGQCRVARTDLIWHRKKVFDNPSAENMIEEFRLVSDYQRCLDLAAQIEPTKVGDKKERRFNALLHSYDEQKRLLAELKKHDSPQALYFLWTQGDNSAIRRFLRFEGTNKLNTPELQYALATYYISHDREKTVKILHRALTLKPKKQELQAKIVESLASVNQSLKQPEYAYIWVMVGKELGLPVASERNLQVLYSFSPEKVEHLQGVADKILNAIESQSFRNAHLPSLKSLQ